MLQASATYREIKSQPEAWLQAVEKVAEHSGLLHEVWQEGRFSSVIFTGCGSTYYLSVAASALFQEMVGCTTRAVPAGELLMYPDAAYPGEGSTLLIALSRSARTTETRIAVDRFLKARRGEVITITNYPDQPIAKMGRLNLSIPAGQEVSVAQTRSFASMLVATAALTATLSGDWMLLEALRQLPIVGRRLIERYEEAARILGENTSLDRIYFLGSGPRYGIACEANLKMKEMSLTHSEAFHFMEFRHGPMSMITDTAAVIGLVSGVNRKYEQAVLDQMQALGAQVFSLAEADADVIFESSLPEAARNVLYLPVLQLAALYRALAKGLDPDHPNNLSSVVELTSFAAL
jgi:glutamine---fructose-6-phosphate transaminase (isomerizing)